MKVQAHHAVRITAFPLCPASLRVPATHRRIACTIACKSRRIIHREGLSAFALRSGRVRACPLLPRKRQNSDVA